MAKVNEVSPAAVRLAGGRPRIDRIEFPPGRRLEITVGGVVWSVWPMADGSLKIGADSLGYTPVVTPSEYNTVVLLPRK